MSPEQFWRKATDIYDLYHGLYRRAVLTDDELRATVTDYIGDMMTLMGEWYNSQGNSKRRVDIPDHEMVGDDNEL